MTFLSNMAFSVSGLKSKTISNVSLLLKWEKLHFRYQIVVRCRVDIMMAKIWSEGIEIPFFSPGKVI